MRAPDLTFADPRLAVLYDLLNGDRSDLDAYEDIADELAVASVVDIGCGTGSLAVRLAGQGRTVIGVDPALASLEVARTKPGAEEVTWVHGDATALLGRGVRVEMAVMTGNVAQVFVSDEDWHSTLAAIHEMVLPGGWFVFETRRPEVRDWERWDVAPTETALADGRTVEVSMTVTEASLPLVTFHATTTVDGEVLPSTSTLRFRDQPEIERDLQDHGFQVVDVRDAPDRPGKELVFISRRISG